MGKMKELILEERGIAQKELARIEVAIEQIHSQAQQQLQRLSESKKAIEEKIAQYNEALEE